MISIAYRDNKYFLLCTMRFALCELKHADHCEIEEIICVRDMEE